MNTNETQTPISTLGEFGLINHLTEKVTIRNKSTVKGIGDDAAIVKYDADQETLISTDLLLEGIHFDLSYTPLKHLGYKSVVVNLSDIIAMGGKPQQITVSLGISSKFSIEAVDELYQGITLACDTYGVDIIGGDTTGSETGLVISITALGTTTPNSAFCRKGANDNDLVVVTGDLGSAYMGLQLLNREKTVWKANPNIQPDLDGNDYVLERQLKPEARADIIRFLNELEVTPTSMIDISDGLSSEIKHICEASQVGVNLYEDKFPIDPTTVQLAIDFNLNPTTVVLNGGEDYELLFTVSTKDFDKIKGNPHMTVIGHITDKSFGENLILKDGHSIELKAQGWNGIKPEEE